MKQPLSTALHTDNYSNRLVSKPSDVSALQSPCTLLTDRRNTIHYTVLNEANVLLSLFITA